MNLPPSEATCSLVAGRTSVAEPTPPSRRAVAIACRPAAPRTCRTRWRAGLGVGWEEGVGEGGGGARRFLHLGRGGQGGGVVGGVRGCRPGGGACAFRRKGNRDHG